MHTILQFGSEIAENFDVSAGRRPRGRRTAAGGCVHVSKGSNTLSHDTAQLPQALGGKH